MKNALQTLSHIEENNSNNNISSDYNNYSNPIKKGIQITRDKIFRIINPSSIKWNVIPREALKQIDEPFTQEEMEIKFPVWNEYIYKQLSNNKNIVVKLLRYENWKAIFSSNHWWITVNIENLEDRISFKSDKIIFPDFWNSKNINDNKESNNWKQDNITSINERLVTPEYIKNIFTPNTNISRKEWIILLKNKFSLLSKINKILSWLSENDDNLLKNNDLILPVKDFNSCLDKIREIKNPTKKKELLGHYKKYYNEFLYTRKTFILNNIVNSKSLESLSWEDLFKLIDFYNELNSNQVHILSQKIKKDILFFIRSYKWKNDILRKRLENYLSKNTLSKADINNIYSLSKVA